MLVEIHISLRSPIYIYQEKRSKTVNLKYKHIATDNLLINTKQAQVNHTWKLHRHH